MVFESQLYEWMARVFPVLLDAYWNVFNMDSIAHSNSMLTTPFWHKLCFEAFILKLVNCCRCFVIYVVMLIASVTISSLTQDPWFFKVNNWYTFVSIHIMHAPFALPLDAQNHRAGSNGLRKYRLVHVKKRGEEKKTSYFFMSSFENDGKSPMSN